MSNQSQLDDRETTLEHAGIIRRKKLLSEFYREIYDFFSSSTTTAVNLPRLELGSGAGFIKDRINRVICSDVIPLPGLDLVCSGLSLPFSNDSLSVIYMIDVFHHLPDAAQFLAEASRCLAPGGQILMVEPANTTWSRFIFRNFHHEEFNPQAEKWQLDGTGRLSSANGALPWIVFSRDYREFTRRFPRLKLQLFEEYSPFLYLLSGGLSLPQLLPGASLPVIRVTEKLFSRWHKHLGLFVKICLVKQ